MPQERIAVPVVHIFDFKNSIHDTSFNFHCHFINTI